ncbi:perlucin-like [Ylistrum balloti]|uniref:perlucin-like n=1 Tax=Ylistrum balloti TaxID=509963 RepID=UPI002905A1D5|nr:perlucin-like [Ylistrum balloti]
MADGSDLHLVHESNSDGPRTETTINDKQRFWTDGSDITEEGKWVWMTSGMPVENYTNWGSSQPDNGSGAVLPSNCLCLGRWMEFQWDDNPCSEAGLVLCEKPDV